MQPAAGTDPDPEKGGQTMPDRQKVFIGLGRCKLYNKENCDKCPYDYNGRGNGKSECTAELAADALALLEEQRRKEECTMGSYPGVYEFYLGRIQAARNYGMRAGTEILDTIVSCCCHDDMLTSDEVSSILYLAGEQHKRIMEDNYNEGWK